MEEKNQAEWIYEVLGKKKGILGASIRKLTDADEKKIREEMLRYWKEHNDESTEFLVNGAVLCCSRGSDYSTLDSADHGVYTDSSEMGALANTGDKKFDGFVSCSKWNEEPLVAKHSCRFKLGEWRNVRKNVSINGKYALDTNSYLPCKHGGIISPVTSGQEYTLSKSYNKYPKFLNDNGTVDELIVKKLLLRNVSVMKENEIDALIKLGIYLCVCEDVNIIKKIICCGYITTMANKDTSALPLYQHTLLDNFIYVSGWVLAYARFCSLTNKLYISSKSLWEDFNVACKKLKDFLLNINIASDYEEQKEIEEQLRMKKQFLNAKLLETILLTGNLYNRSSHDNLLQNLEFKVVGNSIILYTLKYYDGEFSYTSAGLSSEQTARKEVDVALQTVYVFSRGTEDIFSSDKDISEILSKSIGVKNSNWAAVLSVGTTVLSLLVAIPPLAELPFAAALGVICTISGFIGGNIDSHMANNEFEKSKSIYLETIDENMFLLRLEKYLSLYFTFSLRVNDLPEYNENIWNSYEKGHPTLKGKKAREKGYITRDEHRIMKDTQYKELGKGYIYSIDYFDSCFTMKKIKNFNENMKHIKIWSDRDKEYKTVSTNEGIEEFGEIKSIDEMFRYMKKKSQDGIYYMNKLDTLGYAGTEQPAKIIYDYGNGEEKILVEKDAIGIMELFKDNSLR